MNREIKFRMWDKFHQRMYPVWWDDAQYCFGTGYPIMQFTGLKDKNEKEIWEGDIIHISHPHKEREYTGEIYYDEGCGAFKAKEFYFSHHDNPDDFVESIKYVEVIGNIHESNTVEH